MATKETMPRLPLRVLLTLASTSLLALVACGAPPGGSEQAGADESAVGTDPTLECSGQAPRTLTPSTACFALLLDAGCTATARLAPYDGGELYTILCPSTAGTFSFPDPNPCAGEAFEIASTACYRAKWNQVTIALKHTPDPNCPGCRQY
jgi:hypothetical protein